MSTAVETGLKLTFDRKCMQNAFSAVSPAIPSRSPKQCLMSAKLVVGENNVAELMGTDLEVGIRCRVLGVEVDSPGEVLLPTQRFLSILSTCTDETLSLSVDGDTIHVQGKRSKFKLNSEDPATFPNVPEFDAKAYLVVAAGALKQAIRRTIFATDPESTRYALGGCLLDRGSGETLSMVATDGRRLSTQTIGVETEGDCDFATKPVVPVKGMKLLDRNLDKEDPPVHIGVPTDSAIMVRTDMATLYFRLVEGRFPRYQDVFPTESLCKIPLVAGELLTVIDQAAIATSIESTAVLLRFADGLLQARSESPDVGQCDAEMPIPFSEGPAEILLKAPYLQEVLRAVGASEEIVLDIMSGAASRGYIPVIRSPDDRFTHVIMPLTKDR